MLFELRLTLLSSGVSYYCDLSRDFKLGGGGGVTRGCLKHENENDLIFIFSKIDCKAIFDSNLATCAPEKLC